MESLEVFQLIRIFVVLWDCLHAETGNVLMFRLGLLLDQSTLCKATGMKAFDYLHPKVF